MIYFSFTGNLNVVRGRNYRPAPGIGVTDIQIDRAHPASGEHLAGLRLIEQAIQAGPPSAASPTSSAQSLDWTNAADRNATKRLLMDQEP
jgi:hypothetical protein